MCSKARTACSRSLGLPLAGRAVWRLNHCCCKNGSICNSCRDYPRTCPTTMRLERREPTERRPRLTPNCWGNGCRLATVMDAATLLNTARRPNTSPVQTTTACLSTSSVITHRCTHMYRPGGWCKPCRRRPCSTAQSSRSRWDRCKRPRCYTCRPS